MNRSAQISRDAVACLIENVALDLRRGKTTFVAVTVFSPNAQDPSRPITMVFKSSKLATQRVNEVFAALAQNAIEIGALVPD